MKSGQLELNTDKVFSTDFMIYFIQSIGTSIIYNSKTFSDFVMPFMSQTSNDSNFVIVDYQCSSLDIYYNLMEFFTHLNFWLAEELYAFGTYVVLDIVILVSKDFHQTINGKCVLIYSIIQTLHYSQNVIPNYIILSYPTIALIHDNLTFMLQCSAFMWLAIISYDYLKAIRSNVSLQLANINQKKQILKYSIFGFIIPIVATCLLIFTPKTTGYVIFLCFQVTLKMCTGIFFIIFLIVWRIKYKETACINTMNECGPVETKFKRLALLTKFYITLGTMRI